MIPPTQFTICTNPFPLTVYLPGDPLIILNTIRKVIRVDKIPAGVVGRVNIDHLNFPVVALLQQLEHFQIVALNIEVLGVVPVFALCLTGA